MTDVLNILTRKTSLRKACKELSLGDMEKLSENLVGLIEERKVEEAARMEAQKDKLAKLEALKQSILESGIDLSELLDTFKGTSAPKKKGTVSPKYEVLDAEGEIHLWTGRGRTPKVFQDFFNKGGSKEQCLIKSDS